MARRVDPKFGPCDSVLFLALWSGRGQVYKLPDLIGLYDWVDRSIPTAEELDGGLNRLLAAGLVVERRGGFCIPAKVMREYEAFRRRRRRGRFLMAGEFVQSAGPLETTPRRLTIRRADQQRAYAEFHRKFEAACKIVFGSA